MSPTVKLLRELIARPSVNPAFLPAGSSMGGEQRVAEFIAATARKAGLGVEFQRVFPGRQNVVARLIPAGKVRQRILLAPHMDTVGVASELQFVPRAKNGRIYGRGACDTKGSVASMLRAVCEMAGRRERPQNTEIIFAGLVDEENNQSGSRALGQSGMEADLAIVGEPTRLRVMTAHKGDLWLQLETRGKAAHGAKPHLGRNAVHEMARIVDLLETTYARQLRRKRHPLLGIGTINVGSIRGGTQPNLVPDACVISVDRRTLPGENEGTVRREIQDLLWRHQRKARLINRKNSICPPMETSPRLKLVAQFLGAAGQMEGCGADFFCDAAILSEAGIPSVVFGPGDIAQAHTVDEWVSSAQLDRATALLGRFLQSLP